VREHDPAYNTAFVSRGNVFYLFYSCGRQRIHHHDHEEDSAFIPAAKPARAPAIDQIPQNYGPSKPKELSLNCQCSSPNTPMAPCRGNSQYIAAIVLPMCLANRTRRMAKFPQPRISGFGRIKVGKVFATARM
jgi:hypothetical protein